MTWTIFSRRCALVPRKLAKAEHDAKVAAPIWEAGFRAGVAWGRVHAGEPAVQHAVSSARVSAAWEADVSGTVEVTEA